MRDEDTYQRNARIEREEGERAAESARDDAREYLDMEEDNCVSCGEMFDVEKLDDYKKCEDCRD